MSSNVHLVGVFLDLLNDGNSSSSSSGDSSHATDSFWWFNALDAFLFFLLAVAASIRIVRRYHADGGELFPPPTRSQSVYWVFGSLAIYGYTRCVVLGLIASTIISSVGTWEWNATCTIPSFFFVASQCTLIWRWLKGVEELVYEVRHAHYRVGAVVVTSSWAVLLCFVFTTLFSIYDHLHPVTGLTAENWIVLTNVFEGIIYTFNGVCFMVLGLQLVYFWASASPNTAMERRKVLCIAVILCFMCVARGLILVMFALAENSAKVNNVVDSNWGAPMVLFWEWLCLVVAVFVLQNTTVGTAVAQQGGSAAAAIASTYIFAANGTSGLNSLLDLKDSFGATNGSQPTTPRGGGSASSAGSTGFGSRRSMTTETIGNVRTNLLMSHRN